MHRRLTLTAIVLAILLMPPVGDASYIIELNNGTRYITRQYWEEGNQIKFHRYGGTIGLSKASVRKVYESDLEFIDPTELEKTPDKGRPAGPAESPVNGKPATAQAQQEKKQQEEDHKPVDLTTYRQKRDNIAQRYRSQMGKLDEAVKSGDRFARKEASERLQAIEQERANVAREIREKNNGVLPKWWRKGKDPREDGSFR